MKPRFSVLFALVTACSLALTVAILRSGGPVEEGKRGASGAPSTLGKVETGPTVKVAPRIAVAPSGEYLAAITTSPAASGISAAASGASAAHDLVVWRISDGREMARERSPGVFSLSWTRAAIIADDALWGFDGKAGKLASYPAASITPDPQTRWISPGNDFCLEQPRDHPRTLQAARLSTGRAINLAKNIGVLVQHLPPNGEHAPVIEKERFVLDGAAPVGVVGAFVAEENTASPVFANALRGATVSAWDLVAGRILWQWTTQFHDTVPRLLASPNGRWLAVMGAGQEDNRVEVLDAATGQSAASFPALGIGNTPSALHCKWSGGGAGGILVLDDWTWIPHEGAASERQRLLRFFDVAAAKEVKRWDTTKQWPPEEFDAADRCDWAVAQDGQLWAQSTPRDGLRVFRDADFPNLVQP